MASDLIARFDGMVEELRRDPAIEVLHYLVRPPNPSEIEEVERALGYPLGAAITEFYEACGGIQLLWIRKTHEAYEERARLVREEVERSGGSFDEGWFYGGNSGDAMHPDGVILIPSIKRAFLDESFNNNNAGSGVVGMLEAYKAALADPEAVLYRGFEMFYPTVNVAFALHGQPDPVLAAAYDRYEYDDSALIPFREYLELLLVSRGDAKRAFGFLLDSDRVGEVLTHEDVGHWAPNE
ncbi:SMI1/KNR4 family protein [Polyangium sp. 6x1]|uniref:SMI1/KNR4 family protein n=1 Tax=Polyangium sp. 6x1 TaxID=3042689 RepID=UPI002482434F|nr:SMI1/KNR4 family protein [Polyangium sp. 6x1]MDI1450857.1 SMI1/KNR4 family protein [Polyangium sp. 6x1]